MPCNYKTHKLTSNDDLRLLKTVEARDEVLFPIVSPLTRVSFDTIVPAFVLHVSPDVLVFSLRLIPLKLKALERCGDAAGERA